MPAYWIPLAFVLAWVCLLAVAAVGALLSRVFPGQDFSARWVALPAQTPWLCLPTPVILLAVPFLPESGLHPLVAFSAFPFLLLWYLYKSASSTAGSPMVASLAAYLLLPALALIPIAFLLLPSAGEGPSGANPISQPSSSTSMVSSTTTDSTSVADGNKLAEGLFRRNCAVCHRWDQDGAGPALQGRLTRYQGDSVALAHWLSQPAPVDRNWPSMPPATLASDEIRLIARWLVDVSVGKGKLP